MEYPRSVRHRRDFDRQEVAVVESASLGRYPRKGSFVVEDDPSDQLQLFGPKPVCGVEVECIGACLCESNSGYEFRRVSR